MVSPTPIIPPNQPDMQETDSLFPPDGTTPWEEAHRVSIEGEAPQNETPDTGRKILPFKGTTVELPQITKEMQELLNFAPDHDGAAKAVEYQYRDTIRYNPSLGWFHWDGKLWKNDYHEVRGLVKETHRMRHQWGTAYGKAEVARRSTNDHANVSGTMKELEGYVKKDVSDFEGPADLLPVPNGVVDLRSGIRLPHDPKYSFTWNATIDYDSKAECEEWVNFLKSSVGGGDEVIEALQIFTGYMLTGETRENKMLYIHGDTRSGKGVYAETIMSLLPYPIAQEKGVATFTARKDEDANNFDLASLRPARVVFASETTRYQSLNDARIKTMTGDNMLTAAFKGKDSFTFRPRFKVVMTSNFEVNADVDDNAIWGRLVVMEFPHSFLGKEDKGLKERLRAPEAQQGVLRWCVEGAMKYYQRGGLLIPKTLEQAKQASRDKLDTVSMWVADSVQGGSDAFTSSYAIRTSYEQWCTSLGVEPKRARYFTEALLKRLPELKPGSKETEEHEFDKELGRVALVKKKRRGYCGLGLIG